MHINPAFESIAIAREIRQRLNAYKLSPVIMESSGLKEGWQDTIPDFVIQIIVEETLNIHKGK